MKEMLKGKYIDLNFLNLLSEGNEEFFQDMIETFLNDAPGMIIKMEACLMEKRWNELGNLAHNFKTSLTFMGINELSEMIRDMEHSCRSNRNIDLLPDQVGHIKTICQKAIEELTTLRTSFRK